MTRSQWALITGRTVAKWGQGTFEIAMLWTVIHLMHAPWSLAGIVVVGNVVSTLSLPLGGHIVDRRPQHRRLIAALADITAGVVFIAVAGLWPYLGAESGYLVILGITAIQSVLVAFLFPALGSIWQGLVRDDTRQQANSMYTAAQSSARLLGIVFGGALISIMSFGMVLWIVAASFVVSSISSVFIRPVEVPASSTSDSVDMTGFSAWRQFSRNGTVRFFIAVAAMVNGGLIAVTTLLPFYVMHNLHGSGILLGTTEALFTGGLIAGSFISRWIHTRSADLLRLNLVGIASAVFWLGIWPTIWGTESAMAIIGLSVGVLSVVVMTWSQQAIPQSQYGKYLAASSMVSTIIQPALASVAGLTASLLGAPWIYTMVAIGMVLMTSILLLSMRRNSTTWASGNG